MADDTKELETENIETGRYGDDKVGDRRHLGRTLEVKLRNIFLKK